MASECLFSTNSGTCWIMPSIFLEYKLDSVGAKIKSLDQLSELLNSRSQQHMVRVQCHGVFDLMHIGHIRHFNKAKEMGDLLIVTVTPDRFVNKGPTRPVFTEQLRAEAIAALDFVDFVVINQTPTAVDAIRAIKPNFFVKGSEYIKRDSDITGSISVEEQAVLEVGGEMTFTDDVTFSSSNLLNNYFPGFPADVVDFLRAFKKRHKVEDILKYLVGARDMKVLVVGEAIIDEYIFCDAIGKSGKEPVLVTKYYSKQKYAGGVLAVANHSSNFCSHVDCLTFFGEQGEYEDFAKEKLNENVKLIPIYKESSPTIKKTRYVDNYSKQKMFEIYDINEAALSVFQSDELADFLAKEGQSYDAVIVADYGHGLIDQQAVDCLCENSRFLAVNTQANAGNHGFNCIVKYPKADFICIAHRELQLAFREKEEPPEELLVKLAKNYPYKKLMGTIGNKGSITLQDSETNPVRVPALASQINDRVGAGDSVLAITSLCAAQGCPSDILGFIGNAVGAEAVTIMGNERFIEKTPLMKHISHLMK